MSGDARCGELFSGSYKSPLEKQRNRARPLWARLFLCPDTGQERKVSKLMGHAKEIVTVDTYGDNRGIIADAVPELHEYMKDVMPEARDEGKFKEELLEIVVDASEYLPPTR